jgi:hypothetical protein
VEEIEEFPAGHHWTREAGYHRYFAPDWLRPTFDPTAAAASAAALPTGDAGRVRELLKAAVAKRLMSDVGYGLLLSGGLDSAIVCALMAELTDMTKIKSFTVGMADSPDITAAREVARHFGTEHFEYLFTVDEAFALLPRVVYHLETYEPELIRSSIPNYLLAKLAGAHTKVVITGEGADELFAGYLYFRDCPDRAAMQTETLRIWGHLHSVNLQRSDRMGMAHGLEARVPFLDVALLAEAYAQIDPALKMHAAGTRPEKALLRELFEGLIPHDVLWRTKAMQCEGVGTNWVETLQARCAAEVSDADFSNAAATFPRNPPQSKEEFYYRRLFEVHFKGMDRFVHVWPGGCRAGGAAWQSSAYTRAGLADTSQLRHALMTRAEQASDVVRLAAEPASAPSLDSLLALLAAPGDSRGAALELLLSIGGDSRIALVAGANKYGVPPRCNAAAIVRSSCTSSPPTAQGYAAALALLGTMADKRTGTLAAFAAEMDAVRARVAAALDLEAGGEVILAPSGVEAEYLGTALAQYLAEPGAVIRSFVAAAGEVGTSTVHAAAGLSYDLLAPFGRDPPPGERLAGFAHVEQAECPARDAEGAQTDAAAALAAARAAAPPSPPSAWVVRQVTGTKTGFSTAPLPPAAELAGALVVVDACQTRIVPSQIRGHLAVGHIVLITGSKFLHGASFSAAALLPAGLAARVRARADAPHPPAVPAGLAGHFSQHEFAATLPAWRAALHAAPNLGLLLRWHTALPHLEFAAALADERRRELESGWAAGVAALVGARGALSVFASEAGIVSLVCARPAGFSAAGGALSSYGYEELGRMHAWCALDLSHVDGARPCAHAGTVVYIGQPVKIAKVRARGHARRARGGERERWTAARGRACVRACARVRACVRASHRAHPAALPRLRVGPGRAAHRLERRAARAAAHGHLRAVVRRGRRRQARVARRELRPDRGGHERRAAPAAHGLGQAVAPSGGRGLCAWLRTPGSALAAERRRARAHLRVRCVCAQT